MGSQLVASVEYVATHSHAGEARTSSTSSKNVLIIVCAYNEARSLPHLLSTLQGMDTLVVDDGSLDDTMKVARRFGAMVLEHDRRLGKTASLADGLSFAIQNSYDIVIEIDADAIPGRGSLAKITRVLDSPKVGGVSAMQVPLGVPNVAYHIDELIWAILSHGKSFQLQATGSCHFGAVLVAFKPELVGSLHGAINDDEQVGRSIRRRGFKTTFDRSAIAYFDASICIGHIIQRRKRMYVGHFKYARSQAPSMHVRTAALAFAKAIFEKPSRLIWALPALVLDSASRLVAWRDARYPKFSQKYSRWVTSYAKNNILVVRNSNHR